MVVPAACFPLVPCEMSSFSSIPADDNSIQVRAAALTPTHLRAIPVLPERLEGLARLAQNLAWSWNSEARNLFREIDDISWQAVRHNPIRLLRDVSSARLEKLATDAQFCANYDRVMQWLETEHSDEHTWYASAFPELRGRPIAYFCAEFGIHNSVPIYSGGLGVLAGDHIKTASDLGLPLVAVGILYRNGYFDQHVRVDGWQENSDNPVDFTSVPLVPLVGKDGAQHLVTVNTFGRDVHIRVWQVQVGRVPVFLLDSDLEENHPDDRPLLSRLYSGGPAMRLRQEWLLGVGGVRALRVLGLSPATWHANEGHAAFMMVERVREYCASGLSYADAVKRVRNESIFTTHTPVPAGHDHFPARDVERCAAGEAPWTTMGIDAETFLRVGYHPESGASVYHMTSASIRLARRVNAVSRRHGVVTRSMSRSLWNGREPDMVPISHVTNGVHLATWMANSMIQLLNRHLGSAWGYSNDPERWDQVLTLEDEQLWQTHRTLKHILMRRIREQARRDFSKSELEATQLAGAGTLLDPEVLTIGFARRFATYKRANLIFRDVERLRALVTDPSRPVQIVFSGKAHPADDPGKHVLQDVYQYTRDPRFEGRVAFVEDYDMHVAHLLVQGVDMWLNLPRIPLEASGTSGMKAALNGVPQLSTLDGWWEEGYKEVNGWAITPDIDDDEGTNTANRLYELLENEVVPRFYDRDQNELPRHWLLTMKQAIRIAGQQFTSRRMVEQYARGYYAPAILGDALPDDPPSA